MPAMFKVLSRAAAAALAIQTGFAHAAEPPGEGLKAKELRAEPARTGKERLGGKASDEQRVDNCKVPPEQRGPKPRPDTCGRVAGPAGRP
jgi:hypothetical protein